MPCRKMRTVSVGTDPSVEVSKMMGLAAGTQVLFSADTFFEEAQPMARLASSSVPKSVAAHCANTEVAIS